MKTGDYIIAIDTAVAAALDIFKTHIVEKRWEKLNCIGFKEDVSNMDLLVEKTVQDEIRRFFPSAAMLSEESFKTLELTDALTFILDPIDGTRELLAGSNAYSISLAVAEKRQIIAGVVAFPSNKKLFSASIGHGAYCDANLISQNRSCQVSLPRIAVSPREMNSQIVQKTLACLNAEATLIPSLTSKIAAVCANRVDGAIYFGLTGKAMIWDYAAIGLILQECGMSFRDHGGNDIMQKLPLICDNWMAGPAWLTDRCVELFRSAS
jgi:myo-inositol-1(or 4)-monophosphatase